MGILLGTISEITGVLLLHSHQVVCLKFKVACTQTQQPLLNISLRLHHHLSSSTFRQPPFHHKYQFPSLPCTISRTILKMNTPPGVDASLLEYARHFHIAEDTLAVPPATYLSVTEEQGPMHDSPVRRPRDEIRARYETLQTLFARDLEPKKLDISLQEGRLLSTIRREEMKQTQVDWDVMLPPLRRVGSFVVDPLLLTEEEEEALELSRSQALLDDGPAMLLSEEVSTFHGDDTVDELRELTDEPVEDDTAETLDCSKDSVALNTESQNGSSGNEMAALFGDLVDKSQVGVMYSPNDLDSSLTPMQGGSMHGALVQPGPVDEATCVDTTSTLPASTGLGSLAAFMETRGINRAEAGPSTSPYFRSVETPQATAASPDVALSNTSPATILNLTSPPVTSSHDYPTGHLQLVLSEDLLKSHLPLVQSLETRPNPPKILYRDYSQLTADLEDNGRPGEADIVISPQAGIILTTAQALTQRYLPGHKQGKRKFKSPVLERIWHLAPRYERLYVLICYDGSASAVDDQVQGSIASLTGFCVSLSKHTTVVPRHISPRMVTDTVLSLAVKNTPSEMKELRPEPESNWEIELRALGLNTFAALLVLETTTMPAFIDMSTEQRHRQFGDLIGERVLKRVDGEITGEWD